MTTLYDPKQVERLILTIDQLSRDLDAHKALLVQTDKRAHVTKLMVYLSIVVGCIGVAVGAFGISQASTANDAADTAKASSDQVAVLTAAAATESASARVASCINFNAQRFEIRTAIKSSLFALVPPGATPTPSQLAQFEVYNTAVDKGLPYRDCSPAGIEAYFKNPPVDPAVPK